MNDIKSIEDTYTAYVQAQGEANERNKAAVFDTLAVAGITSVKVTFDGCGDSGQIEAITAHAGEEEAPIPKTPITFENVTWGSIIYRSHESVPLPDALENLCYGYLAQLYGGWENNDGAFGEFIFDVAKRAIAFEFNGRFTGHSTDTHTL